MNDIRQTMKQQMSTSGLRETTGILDEALDGQALPRV